jgi:ABC-type sugar transport system ATPase subunit
VAKIKLEMKNISKEFPGVRALEGVNFELLEGEVHALLGINGAGKSTLIKILSGIYGKDSGIIYIDGQEVEINSPQDAMKNGVATVYQDPEMVPTFSGYENIFLGSESEQKGVFAPIDRRVLREKAEEILKQFPVQMDLATPVNEMESVHKEIVAILRALSRQMSILILDEPTSILTETETQVLFRIIRALKEKKVSVIFITHRLEDVYQIADRLTVLRDGKNVATLSVKEKDVDPMTIAEVILGRKIEKEYPEKSESVAEELLTVKNLSLTGCFEDVSFIARKGQILGIFGLVGSGVEEMAKTIYGIFTPTKGQIFRNGKEVALYSADDAIDHGIFLIPGNRRTEGLIVVEPMFFNISLASLNRVTGLLSLVRRKKENSEVRNLIQELAVAPPNLKQKVSFLSGGNQQKVVICKGLFTKAEVYIFVEPTAGVDVGAKASIYRLMRDLSKRAAVVLVSSDCTEVYGMADHVMVMFKGKVTMDQEVGTLSEKEMLLCGVQGS